jgi:integrase/recombinase XerD
LDVVIYGPSSRRLRGVSVFVQRVAGSGSQRESWTVLDGQGGPVEPVERYLAYLSGIERSPNTVKAFGM